MQTAFLCRGAGGGPVLRPDRGCAGTNVLSAGERATLTHDLPRGTYVLLCVIPDELEGVPHTHLGMHTVVGLR